VVDAVEQRHHDAAAQLLRRDGTKGLLERRRLDGDPDDVEPSIEPVGDPYRRLEAPERLALDAQPRG